MQFGRLVHIAADSEFASSANSNIQQIKDCDLSL